MRSLLDFLFPRQLTRLPYLIRVLICNALFFSLSPDLSANSATEWGAWILIDAYTAIFVIWPRIRDIGMSPLWTILAFVPYVNALFGVILLFRRSDLHQNPLLHRPPPLAATAPATPGQNQPAG